MRLSDQLPSVSGIDSKLVHGHAHSKPKQADSATQRLIGHMKVNMWARYVAISRVLSTFWSKFWHDVYSCPVERTNYKTCI